MLPLKTVPRAAWPTLPYQGRGVLLVDENDVLGSWSGTQYRPIAPDGGEGGASAFSDLTDKASADIPAVNGPTGAAISAAATTATWPGITGDITANAALTARIQALMGGFVGKDFGNFTGSANFTASGAAQQVGSIVLDAADLNNINRRLRIHYNLANTGGTTQFKQLTLRLNSTSGAVIFTAQLNAAATAARSVGEVFVDTVGASGRLRSTQEPVTNSGSDTTLSAALDLTAAINLIVCLECAAAVNETAVLRQCHVYLE